MIIIKDLFKFCTSPDFRLRRNDLNSLPIVVPAEAGIQKTLSLCERFKEASRNSLAVC